MAVVRDEYLLNTREFNLTDEDLNAQIRRAFQIADAEEDVWGCVVLKNLDHEEYDAMQLYGKRQRIQRQVQTYSERRENIFVCQVTSEGAAHSDVDDHKWPSFAKDIPAGGLHAENCVSMFQYFTRRLAARSRVYQSNGESIKDLMFLCRNVAPAANVVNHMSLLDATFVTDPVRLSGIVNPHGIVSSPWTGFTLHWANSRTGAVEYVQQADMVSKTEKGGKMFVTIPPDFNDQVEQMVRDAHREFLDSCHDCNSILQHASFFFGLEELRRRCIKYHCVVVRPGECILIRPGAAHEGGNMSAGISVAKNFLLREQLPYLLKTIEPCVCRFRIEEERARVAECQRNDQPITFGQLGDPFGVCACRTAAGLHLQPCPDVNNVIDLRGLVSAVMDERDDDDQNLKNYMNGTLMVDGVRAKPPMIAHPLTPNEVANVRAFVKHLEPATQDAEHRKTMRILREYRCEEYKKEKMDSWNRRREVLGRNLTMHVLGITDTALCRLLKRVAKADQTAMWTYFLQERLGFPRAPRKARTDPRRKHKFIDNQKKMFVRNALGQ